MAKPSLATLKRLLQKRGGQVKAKLNSTSSNFSFLATSPTLISMRTFVHKWLHNKYVVYVLLIILVFAFTVSNLFFAGGGRYSLAQVTEVLSNPTYIPDALSKTKLGLSIDDYRFISYSIWGTLSTFVAGAGLAVAGLATQSLTRNPLADASTLGLMQGGVLALIVALSFGWTAYYLKLVAVIVGIIAAALILFVVIWFNRARTTTLRIILAGLALSIVFRTFGFIVRTSGSDDRFLNSVSYAYTLGGAEAVNAQIGSNQWMTLYISTGLVLAGILLMAALARPLSLLDLGDEKARQLGVPIRLVKALSILALVLTVPASVIIVGNLAFIGLFGAHFARYLIGTRSYSRTMLPAILVGIFLAQFGYLLSNFIPVVNSGIWMTIIGAPYLIYIGLRGVR